MRFRPQVADRMDRPLTPIDCKPENYDGLHEESVSFGRQLRCKWMSGNCVSFHSRWSEVHPLRHANPDTPTAETCKECSCGFLLALADRRALPTVPSRALLPSPITSWKRHPHHRHTLLDRGISARSVRWLPLTPTTSSEKSSTSSPQKAILRRFQRI